MALPYVKPDIYELFKENEATFTGMLERLGIVCLKIYGDSVMSVYAVYYKPLTADQSQHLRKADFLLNFVDRQFDEFRRSYLAQNSNT